MYDSLNVYWPSCSPYYYYFKQRVLWGTRRRRLHLLGAYDPGCASMREKNPDVCSRARSVPPQGQQLSSVGRQAAVAWRSVSVGVPAREENSTGRGLWEARMAGLQLQLCAALRKPQQLQHCCPLGYVVRATGGTGPHQALVSAWGRAGRWSSAAGWEHRRVRAVQVGL